jgi:hypothetical protein
MRRTARAMPPATAMVVVLDQHAVVERHAMVRRPAHAHRVLLDLAQQRRRSFAYRGSSLAPRWRARTPRASVRNARQPLQQIQRRALGRKQRRGASDDPPQSSRPPGTRRRR